MKAALGSILRPEQERYLERLLLPRDAILAEMEAQAAHEDVPISDPEVGRLLQVLARGSRAKRIVEIGTAIGYGTLCLARGAPEARVLSIDNDPARLATARAYLERAGVAERVELVQGEALAVLPDLAPPIDLAYIDAVKTEYRRYLDLLLPKLAVGGMLVFDNLLWKGWIAEPPEDDEADDSARALRAFNGYLLSHPQLAAVVLPLGDGVGLATKTKPLMTELGGPW